jgi:hypothetical protein
MIKTQFTITLDNAPTLPTAVSLHPFDPAGILNGPKEKDGQSIIVLYKKLNSSPS